MRSLAYCISALIHTSNNTHADALVLRCVRTVFACARNIATHANHGIYTYVAMLMSLYKGFVDDWRNCKHLVGIIWSMIHVWCAMLIQMRIRYVVVCVCYTNNGNYK